MPPVITQSGVVLGSDAGCAHFRVRELEFATLPLDPSIALLHPERLILKFDSGMSVDLGAYCFLRRSKVTQGGNGLARPHCERLIDPESFDVSRRDVVNSILIAVSDRMTHGGKRPMTVHGEVKALLTFLDWSDAHGHYAVLRDTCVTRKAFAEYVTWMRERVAQGILSVNTAAVRQFHILSFSASILDVDNLDHGVNLLQLSKASRQATQPPSEKDQGQVLALCLNLFNGLSDLSLGNRPYPYWLTVPQNIAAPGNGLWVFPTMKWCMPPHELANRESLLRGYWVFDYANGRFAEPAEIAHRYSAIPGKSTAIGIAQVSVGLARRSMERANSDARHHHRLLMALLAHNCFIVLFLAHTGMNLASVQNLRWGGDFEVGVERQGFRTVKYRAAGATVTFEIQPVFLVPFKRFLEVRNYLLNGRPFDMLFMSANSQVTRVEPLKQKTLANIIKSLQRIDPSLPKIMSKRWRAGKSDWLLRTTDPSTTAIVLQNSEQTVLRSYASGSPTTHMDEMGSFFDRLHDVVVSPKSAIRGLVEHAIGKCSSFGNPQVTGTAPLAPDCRGAEGCLFCDNFRVHADERDTRKLISCRYCLHQSAHLAASEEHFLALFGPILDRIAVILSEVSRREAGLVERIEREVIDEGELDPYWASKLEMLVNLELTT